MQTIYDWVAIALFAGLVVLFLHRSSMEAPSDRVWHYLPPAVACAVANYLGNEGYGAVPAASMLVFAVVYTYFVLRPGRPRG